MRKIAIGMVVVALLLLIITPALAQGQPQPVPPIVPAEVVQYLVSALFLACGWLLHRLFPSVQGLPTTLPQIAVAMPPAPHFELGELLRALAKLTDALQRAQDEQARAKDVKAIVSEVKAEAKNGST